MAPSHIDYNYILSFRGWALYRMATDPDPDIAPRGVSGYTFALPGEPDLDQIIYFHMPRHVKKRSFCPEIGVRVDGGCFYKTIVTDPANVAFDGERQEITPGHPLYNASVDLLGKPHFDSRNSTIVYNGYGMISPFELQFSGDGISISRSFFVDPENPTNDLETIPINELTPHVMTVDLNDATEATNPDNRTPGSPDMLLEAGILNKVAYRRERLDKVIKEREAVTDDVYAAALDKRIMELKIDDPINRRTAQLGAKVLVPYSLNSRQATVNGKPVLDAGPAWTMEMWLGGFDADALSFFVLGTVKIVLNCDPRAE